MSAGIAGGRSGCRPGSSVVDGAAAGFQLMSLESLQSLPDPEWLIRDLLPEGAICEVHGKPGSGKSFLALDWAMSIALGQPWQGRPVRRGDVIYIAGERARSLKKRSAAWMKAREAAEWPEVQVLNRPVQLLRDMEVDALIRLLAKSGRKPALIVLDTFSTAFVGGAENQSGDMTLAMHSLYRIQEATGATILVIHHTLKNSSDERGHSALRGRMDLMYRVERRAEVVKLARVKANDEKPTSPVLMRLRQVAVSETATSCVLDGIDGASQSETEPSQVHSKPKLPAWTEALRVLSSSQDGLTSTEWERGVGSPYSTHRRHLAALKEHGYVEAVAGTGGEERFRVTREGMDWLATRAGGGPSTDSRMAA